jgi:hypothetical protein
VGREARRARHRLRRRAVHPLRDHRLAVSARGALDSSGDGRLARLHVAARRGGVRGARGAAAAGHAHRGGRNGHGPGGRANTGPSRSRRQRHWRRPCGDAGARRRSRTPVARPARRRRDASDVFERTVAAAGARCTRCDVYRTVASPPVRAKRPLSALRVDNVLLASPSAAQGFVHQIDADVPARIVTIGPSTTAAVERLGLAVSAEAREPSLEGMVEAMQWRN